MDAAFRQFEDADLDVFINAFEASAPFDSVDPAYARSCCAMPWPMPRTLGLEPHPDFAHVELLFGDISADDSDGEFQFGAAENHAYITGPSDSPTQIRQRLKRLRRRLGEGGFDFVEMLDGFEDLDFEDDDESEDDYDPDNEPDPEIWLALDEGGAHAAS